MTGTSRRFGRTIGIDYSGAETAEASLKALRVYQTLGDDEEREVSPPPGPRKYWTRRAIADWLVQQLDGRVPTIVGIDHAFSFPMRYFERHRVAPDWKTFLADFCAHWPTDQPHTYVDFVRDGSVGSGAARMGDMRWRRLTEEAIGLATSVFHFDGRETTAKSTHAGIPWLQHIRTARPEIHFWPFEGWTPGEGSTVITETHPSLWRSKYPSEGRTRDQHAAYSMARWLQEVDQSGDLTLAFEAPEPEPIAASAIVEGWILGATWPPVETPKPASRKKRAKTADTSRPAFNRLNSQDVGQRTALSENDQVVHIIRCQRCGERYGARGSERGELLCPACARRRPTPSRGKR